VPALVFFTQVSGFKPSRGITCRMQYSSPQAAWLQCSTLMAGTATSDLLRTLQIDLRSKRNVTGAKLAACTQSEARDAAPVSPALVRGTSPRWRCPTTLPLTSLETLNCPKSPLLLRPPFINSRLKLFSSKKVETPVSAPKDAALNTWVPNSSKKAK